jgi:hypothetical protein
MKILKALLLVALLVGGIVAYLHYEEKASHIAVLDSFESRETNSGYEYRIKFHNNTTAFEGLCVETVPADRCKRFSAGERHQFSTFGGVLVFPDMSDKYLVYTETKESLDDWRSNPQF